MAAQGRHEHGRKGPHMKWTKNPRIYLALASVGMLVASLGANFKWR